MEKSSKTTKTLIIVGETASGKSSLALQLAQRFNGEIICADSWTVRREVSIGTAKPSKQDRHLISHHLLDIVDPDADFTAAVFKRMASSCIEDISARGKLPIVVGGTGLYIDSLIYDYKFLKAGNRSNRIALNELSVEELMERVFAEGISIAGVDVRNKRRLIRLLETGGEVPTKSPIRAETILIGLKIEQAELNERIEKRTDTMIERGLAQEVLDIAQKYGWECEALKGIGYAQWKLYFESTQTLQETRQKIIKSTRDLAKRQRTWFKRNKSIQWFDTPVNMQLIVDYITTNLDNLYSQ